MPERRKPEPRVVDLALAEAGDVLSMSALAPGELSLEQGEELHVRLRYRIEEASRERDGYQFVLSSRLGDEQPEPAAAVWGDTWGHRDEVEGAVRNRFRPPPGTWDLEFHASVTHTRQGWRTGGALRSKVQEVAGVVRVVVKKAKARTPPAKVLAAPVRRALKRSPARAR